MDDMDGKEETRRAEKKKPGAKEERKNGERRRGKEETGTRNKKEETGSDRAERWKRKWDEGSFADDVSWRC